MPRGAGFAAKRKANANSASGLRYFEARGPFQK